MTETTFSTTANPRQLDDQDPAKITDLLSESLEVNIDHG